MYRPMTEQRVYLTNRRLANQLDEEQRLRESAPPSTSPPATKPSSTEQPAQLDLTGGTVPTGPRPDPTGGRFTGPGSGQQQALPVTVARSYRSKAWGGTVTESPLDLTAEET